MRVSTYKVAPLPFRCAMANWRPANETLSISPPWNSKKASESQNQWGFGRPPKLQGQGTEQEQASKILPKILSEAGACAASVPVEGVSPCPATMEPAAAAAQRYDKIERVIETRVGAFGLNESVDRRHPAQRTTLTSDLTKSRTGCSQRALQRCGAEHSATKSRFGGNSCQQASGLVRFRTTGRHRNSLGQQHSCRLLLSAPEMFLRLQQGKTGRQGISAACLSPVKLSAPGITGGVQGLPQQRERLAIGVDLSRDDSARPLIELGASGLVAHLSSVEGCKRKIGRVSG